MTTFLGSATPSKLSRARHLDWLLVAVAVVPFAFTVAVPGSPVVQAVFALWLAAIMAALVAVRRYRRRIIHREAVLAAEQARSTERLRIAADLHDIVSHGLGAITLRAAVAQEISGEHAASEREAALADIEKASRDATVELRRMLTVLRSDADAPLQPAQSLSNLPGIVADFREQGLNIRLREELTAEVSPGVQQAVCVVVREGLANVRRHAGSTSVAIRIWQPEEGFLAVEVCDDGPTANWTAQPGTGHGLTGLQSRVEAMGGTLTASPNVVGPGFTLRADFADDGQ